MKLYVFSLKVTLISNTRLAGEGRIKEILGVQDLPKEVRPLLRQAVIPSDALDPLLRQKTRATSLLIKNASRNPFGGWNIIPERTREVLQGMEVIREEFYRAKAELLANLDAILAAHLDGLRKACEASGYRHVDAFVEAVRDAQPKRDYLDSQIGFEYLKPKLIEYDAEEAPVMREGVYGQALHEIAVRAIEAGRAKSIRSRLRAVDEIVSKLNGLGYIEGRLRVVATHLDQALGSVPRDLREKDYTAVQNMALTHVLGVLGDDASLADAVDRDEALFSVPDEAGGDGSELFAEKAETDTRDEAAPSVDAASDARAAGVAAAGYVSANDPVSAPRYEPQAQPQPEPIQAPTPAPVPESGQTADAESDSELVDDLAFSW